MTTQETENQILELYHKNQHLWSSVIIAFQDIQNLESRDQVDNKSIAYIIGRLSAILRNNKEIYKLEEELKITM